MDGIVTATKTRTRALTTLYAICELAGCEVLDEKHPWRVGPFCDEDGNLDELRQQFFLWLYRQRKEIVKMSEAEKAELTLEAFAKVVAT